VNALGDVLDALTVSAWLASIGVLLVTVGAMGGVASVLTGRRVSVAWPVLSLAGLVLSLAGLALVIAWRVAS
jgi:hypothetical protein